MLGQALRPGDRVIYFGELGISRGVVKKITSDKPSASAHIYFPMQDVTVSIPLRNRDLEREPPADSTKGAA